MSKTPASEPGDKLPILHLNETFPDGKGLFSVDLPNLEQIRDTALVVLDTNVLLVPYTINRKSLNEIGGTYENLISENRLFIPAQVAREFARHRPGKIGELVQQLSRFLSDKRSKEETEVGDYPLLASVDGFQRVRRLDARIKRLARERRSALKDVLEHVRQWRWNDPVSELYRALFTPNIVVEIETSATEVEGELQRRQSLRLPPGFKDAKKDDGGVGDLLIWLTILDLGRTRQRDIIFVSNEEKADWWHRNNGPLYPRFELIDEFRRVTEGRSFHLVKFSDALDLFGAGPDVVEEVRSEEAFQLEFSSSPRSAVDRAVFSWLADRYSGFRISTGPHGVYDVTDDGGTVLAFDCIEATPRSINTTVNRIKASAAMGRQLLETNRVGYYGVIIAYRTESGARKAGGIISRLMPRMPKVSWFLGWINDSGDLETLLENEVSE